MRKGLIAVILVVLCALSSVVIYAAPSGPTSIGLGASSRYSGESNGALVNALAGNVTQLDINGTSITQGWQGYFGNVLGTIVLGNNNNKTLYDWSLLAPSGQVYASRNSSVSWTTLNCSNQTVMQNVIAAEEAALNFPVTAKDGINETFTSTSYPSFFVGSLNITANTCYNTNLHNSSGQKDATRWYEILLRDSSNGLVYTSLLENNGVGFDGSSYDFQMIVAEDGHNGDTSTTPYYFWIELQ